MMNPGKCPLMQHDARIGGRPGQDGAIVDCPVCGPYQISRSLISCLDQLSEDERRAVTFYVRDCKENALPPPVLITNNVMELKDKFPTFPVAEKSRRLLLKLARASKGPGADIIREPLANYIPLLRAQSEQEVRYFFEYLISSGLINEVDRDRVRLTYHGWSKIEEHHLTKRAFVAMWFNPTMDAPYQNGIHAGIKDAGYDPVCMKDLPHNDKICDRIEIEIRSSAFVIADFTGQRGGVYFEAGFARGLGKPVIWLCREDESKQIHFDTRQYNHIFWNDVVSLRKDLATRIEATITPMLALRKSS